MREGKIRWLCSKCKNKFERRCIETIKNTEELTNNVAINNMEELIDIVNIHHIVHLDTCPSTVGLLQHLPSNFQKLNITSGYFGSCLSIYFAKFESFVVIDNIFLQDYKIYAPRNIFSIEMINIDSDNNNKTILINMKNNKYIPLIKQIVLLCGYELTNFYDRILQINRPTLTKRAIK